MGVCVCVHQLQPLHCDCHRHPETLQVSTPGEEHIIIIINDLLKYLAGFHLQRLIVYLSTAEFLHTLFYAWVSPTLSVFRYPSPLEESHWVKGLGSEKYRYTKVMYIIAYRPLNTVL